MDGFNEKIIWLHCEQLTKDILKSETSEEIAVNELWEIWDNAKKDIEDITLNDLEISGFRSENFAYFLTCYPKRPFYKRYKLEIVRKVPKHDFVKTVVGIDSFYNDIKSFIISQNPNKEHDFFNIDFFSCWFEGIHPAKWEKAYLLRQ